VPLYVCMLYAVSLGAIALSGGAVGVSFLGMISSIMQLLSGLPLLFITAMLRPVCAHCCLSTPCKLSTRLLFPDSLSSAL
jgi:hypothetical protein